MNQANLILLALLAAGIIGGNKTVTAAVLVLLLIRVTGLHQAFPVLERHGLNLGIIILTAAVLTPLATGEISLGHIGQTFMDLRGFLALVIGVLVAYLGGKGVDLLAGQPQIVTGLVVGTVIGVAFFRGVPVGPVIAAGIAAVVFRIFD